MPAGVVSPKTPAISAYQRRRSPACSGSRTQNQCTNQRVPAQAQPGLQWQPHAESMYKPARTSAGAARPAVAAARRINEETQPGCACIMHALRVPGQIPGGGPLGHQSWPCSTAGIKRTT
jgi:hypothetical protein